MVTGWARVTRGAGADGFAVDRVGVAVRAFVAGVTDAGVIQVAQQTCAAMWALAVERGHPVVAGSTLEAGSHSTVINVLTAVLAGPAVDTYAVVAAVVVVARSSILAGIRHELALINIFSAILACPLRKALAVVGVNSIHTGASILAVVPRTVINVVLTVLTSKTWKTRAVVGGFAGLTASAPVLAGRRVARHVEVLTVLAHVCWLAGTLVGPDLIGAAPAILADGRTDVALVHVLLAVGPMEALSALADVMGFERNALPSVGTGVGGTGVCLQAGLS